MKSTNDDSRPTKTPFEDKKKQFKKYKVKKHKIVPVNECDNDEKSEQESVYDVTKDYKNEMVHGTHFGDSARILEECLKTSIGVKKGPSKFDHIPF